MRKLKKYKQEHLLMFYDDLEEREKRNLKRQIKKINFRKMRKLYKNSFKDDVIDIDKVTSLKSIKKSKKYMDSGIDFIKKGEYAVVIMAGGNGSRLGFKGPKGCLELNIEGKFVSLFEIYICQLKEMIRKYNIVIPLYIMTSSINNDETVNFFEKKNYFNYPKDKIRFFEQDNLPILDVQGNLVLKDRANILFGPNGNGDIFKSLRKNHLIKDMEKNRVKYALFINVDNVLNDLVDFDFIGSTIENNYKLASKTIKLSDKKEWIFCKYKNHPFMLPSSFLNNELFNEKKDDEYVYRYKNISYHIISIDLIKKFSRVKLPYHRAYKRSNYINSLNQKNSFKFEKFIFDAFYYADDMLLYETDNSDFYPIKRIDDIKKAIEQLKKKDV